ncbi:ATP-binding protein [Sphingomonas sp. 1P06PA]|uniref:hybrid sensor histidine kinase/response regulator n=1 Tax=Sphingomonas sp. 1P06PA TaxID=554121 RepID=UPI0039A4D160
MHRTAGEGFRVLIVAPYGRDAESLAQLLLQEGYSPEIHGDLAGVAASLGDDTGVIILTEEALATGLDSLVPALEAEPAWSDIPFILFCAPSRARSRSSLEVRHGLPPAITNVVVLERPLGSATLLTSIASAMRARQKQFEMRDRMRDLADSEARLRLATDAADIGTWDYDPATDRLRWDARCKALFGLPADAEISLADSFYPGLHPDDVDAARAAVERAMDPGGDGVYDIEYRTIGLGDGVERWIAAKGGSIFQDGRVVRFIGTVIDITARKQTELELDRLARTLEQKVAERTAELEAEMASRSRAEAALRQSQKMEAVGQLTGGIAHDFNNMLTGVIGAMDIMKRRLADGRTDDLERFMDAAATSAQRAAALTARLLAFSRRQSLDARPVDVNALAAGLEDLLRRSIRENIVLRIVTTQDLPLAVADANQLESAILNLVINARDAMPDGGQLTVETGAVTLDAAYAATRPDVTPGRYVVIAVSDSGVGMPPDVLEKVFEPFFSTKPLGQGTGLGLSMVYGFARQSGGQVRIHSHPGGGTSVKIYLPVSGDALPDAAAPAVTHQGQGQTVLLVEDDGSVRLLVREVLEELGYATLEAADADSALPILHSDRRIDLLVSDVGLPGINGRQLAELARRQRPDLPILFVTGYAENAAIRADFLGSGMDMITKPFAIEQLSAKVAEIMAG